MRAGRTLRRTGRRTGGVRTATKNAKITFVFQGVIIMQQ
jgi:hypothetical protein